MSVTSGHVRSAPPTAYRRAGLRVAARLSALPIADATALATLGVLARATIPWVLAYGAAVLSLLAVDGRYRRRFCLRTSEQVPRITVAAGMPLAVVLPWWPRGEWAGTGLLLAAASVGLLVASRSMACGILRVARRRGAFAERALVLGTDPVASRINRVLAEHPEYGLRAHGFLDRRHGPAPAPAADPTELTEQIQRYGITCVLVCFPAVSDDEMVSLLRGCRSLPVDVFLVPRLHDLGMAVPRGDLDELWGIPLIAVRRPSRVSGALKRAFDVVLGGMLIIITFPLLAVLMVLVAAGKGTALFRQTRVTRDGRLANMIKLKTVHNGLSWCWTIRGEQCGRLGRWLRGTHLDELPQLFNVLRGEMSLVGPRPERPYYAARFTTEIPGYADRHRVLGGLTGWAQVNGLHGDTSIPDRARFDNQYIEYWSLCGDVVILARTVGIVLTTIVLQSATTADLRRKERQ